MYCKINSNHWRILVSYCFKSTSKTLKVQTNQPSGAKFMNGIGISNITVFVYLAIDCKKCIFCEPANKIIIAQIRNMKSIETVEDEFSMCNHVKFCMQTGFIIPFDCACSYVQKDKRKNKSVAMVVVCRKKFLDSQYLILNLVGDKH